MKKDLLTINDLSPAEINDILKLADELKEKRKWIIKNRKISWREMRKLHV